MENGWKFIETNNRSIKRGKSYYCFRLGATLLLFLNPSFLVAEDSCHHDEENFRCVRYLKNYDADTITFEIPGVHALLGKNISIRVNGVDTPELRTKDNCEKKMGYAAKDIVTEFIKNAKRVDLTNIKRGKYFRIVADVIVDGNSLSDLLLKKHLAYRYDGGTKRKINWCRHLKRLPASILNKQNRNKSR